MAKGLSATKAKKILEDGKVRGKALTEKQKKFFGAVAGGATPLKKLNGGWLEKFDNGGVQPNYNDSNVSLPPGFKGYGYDKGGRAYNGAWNGPVAQEGIELNTKYIDSTFNANMDKRWVQRLYERNPEFYLEGQTKPSTHFMESGDGYVYPRVMEGADGQLKEVSREEGRSQGIKFPNDEIAQWFAKNYKKGTNVLKEYQMGGSLSGATGMMYSRTSGTSPEEPKKAQDGTVMYGTPEYEAAYREGRFANVPNPLDEVVIDSGVDYSQYPLYDKLSAQQKEYFNDPGAIGRGVRRAAQTDRGLAEDTRDMVTGMLVQQPLAALQAPQSLMVEGIEALRGRDANLLNALTFDTQRLPSQTMGFEDKPGWDVGGSLNTAMDVLADPTNLVGAGIAKNPIKGAISSVRGNLGKYRPIDASIDAAAPSLRQSLLNDFNSIKKGVANLTNPLSDTRVGLTEVMGLIKGGKFKSKYKGFNESGVKAASDFGKAWQKAPGFQTRFDDFTYQVNDPVLTRQVRNNQNLYNQGLEKLKAKQPDLFTPNDELAVPLSTIQKMFPRLADDAMLLKRLNDQIVEGASKINYANNARMNADQIGATGRFTKVMKPTSADDINYFADNPNTLGFFRASENRALIDIDRFESNYRNLSKKNWKLSRTVAHENKHAMDAGARATRPEYARTIQSAVPQVTDDYTKVLTGANKKDIKKVYGNIKNLGDDTTESIEYLSRPQEVAARVDELRMEYIPKKFWGTDKQYEVSDDLINKIISEGKAGKTSVDVRFFKMIKDKEAFKNLFKVLPAVAAPVAIGTAQQKNGGWLDKFQEGGVIEDDRGQWAHPGKVTKINSNNITMKGVNYPVLGVSDTGDTKMMQPGVDNYKYDGNSVTEYPMAKDGKSLVELNQLTNFTNYNTPQPGGWLDKY